jgi:alkanesulfonate monooxygenase SsuD/methylene tetrahydromethanopterin reductase-like flavin-dependent oxidoreductase (luciferase family)
LAQSRARFEEAFDIITRAWTEEIFSYDGVFWSYKDVALWPRPLQRPRPPIWMPIVGSKESIEFAARHKLPITPGSRPLAGPARGHHPPLRPRPGAIGPPHHA